MKLPTIAHTAVAVALGLAAANGHAETTRCVANSAELRSALTMAVNDDLTVRIKVGTYQTGGDAFYAYLRQAYALRISGGWTGAAGECTVQTPNAALTVLDGVNDGFVMSFEHDDSLTTATGEMSNITFTGGVSSNGAAGCLNVYFDQGSPTVLFDRLRIVGCSNGGGGGTGGGLRVRNFAAAKFTLRNSLVALNTADRGAGIALQSNTAGAITYLINNTVVDNASSLANGGAGLFVSGSPTPAGTIELRNNAFASNTANAIDNDVFAAINSTGVIGFNNAYGAAPGGLTTDTGEKIGNPGFRSMNDYRLAADSPLIDAGAPLSPDDAASHDLVFQTRVLGQAPDIGAYESNFAVFRNGFE